MTTGMTVRRNLLSSLLDIIVPRTCAICGRRLDTGEDIVCTVCLLRMPLTGFLDNPYNNDMAKMFWGRIKHMEKAFALAYHYPHADSAHPVYQLKYYEKPDVGVAIGLLMGRMMKEKGFLDGIDAILPIPLAGKRRRERGYNQSEMIALGLHDASGLKVLNDVVRRVSFEGSQTQKDRWDRAENVENAFELANGGRIRGMHVLIVDDVVTTGATVCAMARQIERVEGVRISVAATGYAGHRAADGGKDVSPEPPG